MMKKITLLFILIGFAGFSQTELLNLTFDAAGSESIWTPIADAAGKPAEVIIAFDASGNGTGATQLSGINADGVGGRAYIFRYNNTTFDFGSAGSLSISMDLKIDAALQGTNLQFETQVSKVGGGVLVGTHQNLQNDVPVGGGWTTLTFDMTPTPSEFNNNGTELYFFFNMAAGAFADAGGAFFVDNIVITADPGGAPTCSDGIKNQGESGIDCGGPCAACPVPLTAAPTPTQSSANVISIYSEITNSPDTSHYSDVANTNFNPNWGSTSGNVVEEAYGGDLVLKYPNLDYQGTLIAGDGGSLDVSSMTYLHFDFWTNGGTSLRISVISTTTGEVPYDIDMALGALPQSQWVGIDVPLSYLTDANPGFNFVIKELKFDQGLNKDFYFDNIFFTTEASLGVNNIEKSVISLFPNPTQSSWTVKTQNVVMSSIRVFDMLGKQVLSLSPNASETSIDGSNLKTGLYFAQISTATGISSLKLVKQ